MSQHAPICNAQERILALDFKWGPLQDLANEKDISLFVLRVGKASHGRVTYNWGSKIAGLSQYVHFLPRPSNVALCCETEIDWKGGEPTIYLVCPRDIKPFEGELACVVKLDHVGKNKRSPEKDECKPTEGDVSRLHDLQSNSCSLVCSVCCQQVLHS